MEAMKEIKFKDKLIGRAFMEEDGFYYFYPTVNGGWCEFGLQYVLDKLKELNKDYNELLEKQLI